MSKCEHAAAISRLFRNYADAANASDASALARFFTDDGVRYSPNTPAAVGKDAVRSAYQAVFDQFSMVLKSVEVVEVEANDEWAFARGSFALTLIPKGVSKPIDDTGNWLDILKRQPDGSWKIYRDMFNSDRPL